MPSQLPSGMWRPRVRHPRTHKHLNPRAVIGGPDTYPTREEAKAAEDRARRALLTNARLGVTVREFWEEWTIDPRWQRPAKSTNIHRRDATRKFVEKYGQLPIRAIGDEHVADWLRGGGSEGSAKVLCTMWNDAASVVGGRLVDRNPWLKLGLRSGRGRKKRPPPTQAAVSNLITLGDELTPPSFAAYLDVAVYEGMRPGELDALRWTKLDFQAGTILVDEQWNAISHEFTLPKHGIVRTITMTGPAKKRLLSLPRESEFVFTTVRGSHYRPSSRTHHWNRVRAAAGLGTMELYMCTRHYFGWYAWNVLELDARDIALHFGHQDGGELVRTLYGHADAALARDRVRAAFEGAPPAPVPLRRAARATDRATTP
jgi:integrase